MGSQRTLKFHGTVTALCIGLAASMWACLGDDDVTGGSGGSGGAPAADSSMRDSARDTSVDTSVSPDVAFNDVSATDVLADNSSDARDGVTTDTTASDAPDAAPDAGSSDSSTDRGPDGTAGEAGSDAPPPVHVQLCPQLDVDWDIATDAGGCATTTNNTCGDRGGTWGTALAEAFAGLVSGDCRISRLLEGLDGTTGPEYLIQLATFNLAFYGCPDPTLTTGFDLIPATQSGHVFTTADMRVMSELYVQSLVGTLEDAALPPVASQELVDIDAQIARQAAAVPGTVTSSNYTLSSCPDDAGTGAD
jgi:hypothetical protein